MFIICYSSLVVRWERMIAAAGIDRMMVRRRSERSHRVMVVGSGRRLMMVGTKSARRHQMAVGGCVDVDRSTAGQQSVVLLHQQMMGGRGVDEQTMAAGQLMVRRSAEVGCGQESMVIERITTSVVLELRRHERSLTGRRRAHHARRPRSATAVGHKIQRRAHAQ